MLSSFSNKYYPINKSGGKFYTNYFEHKYKKKVNYTL